MYREQLLFICSRNQWRSPTAAALFENSDLYERILVGGDAERCNKKIHCIAVLTAGTPKQLPSTLTVAWAVASVAALGGYLEHRSLTPIGIQVPWQNG